MAPVKGAVERSCCGEVGVGSDLHQIGFAGLDARCGSEVEGQRSVCERCAAEFLHGPAIGDGGAERSSKRIPRTGGKRARQGDVGLVAIPLGQCSAVVRCLGEGQFGLILHLQLHVEGGHRGKRPRAVAVVGQLYACSIGSFLLSSSVGSLGIGQRRVVCHECLLGGGQRVVGRACCVDEGLALRGVGHGADGCYLGDDFIGCHLVEFGIGVVCHFQLDVVFGHRAECPHRTVGTGREVDGVRVLCPCARLIVL